LLVYLFFLLLKPELFLLVFLYVVRIRRGYGKKTDVYLLNQKKTVCSCGKPKKTTFCSLNPCKTGRPDSVRAGKPERPCLEKRKQAGCAAANRTATAWEKNVQATIFM
jgi:hypothetical protein